MWQVAQTNGTVLPNHSWNDTNQSEFNDLVNDDVLFELYVSISTQLCSLVSGIR